MFECVDEWIMLRYCIFCNEEFATEPALNQHFKELHPIKLAKIQLRSRIHMEKWKKCDMLYPYQFTYR